nr:MAG TPA: hypothetical protein [Caudoviricetes sp.]
MEPIKGKDQMCFSWGSGYMLLNTNMFYKLSQKKQNQIIAAVCKAAERSK